MEIGLQIIEGNQISVTCNQEFSHSFPGDILAPIYAEEIPSDSITVGKILYECVFQKDSLAQTTLSSNPERILFVPDNPELDALPWEALYGPDGFLVLDFPFVRGLPEDKRIPAPDLSNLPLQVFAILSNPLSEDLPRLNTKLEWMILVESINSTNNVTCLERVFPPTLEQTRLLSANKPNSIIHFFGHGDSDNLYFEKDNGNESLISAQDFQRRVGNNIFMLSLSACDSAAPVSFGEKNIALSLVKNGIPYVLGMKYPIRVEDASIFFKTFYAEISRGITVEKALHQSRITIFTKETISSLIIPVLYTSTQEILSTFNISSGEPLIDDHSPIVKLRSVTRNEGKFQGRINELRQLGNYLTMHTPATLINIQGIGGQGKTSLAYEAVNRFSFAWPGGVYALSLEHMPSHLSFCTQLANLMNIPVNDLSKLNEIEEEILKRLENRRSIIFIDNFETLIDEIRKGNADAISLGIFIKEKIRSTLTCLLITSRELLDWPEEVIIKLDGLLDNEGASLFLQHTPNRRKEVDFTKIKSFISTLEGHPLAIVLLAKTFNESHYTFDDFQEKYNDQLLAAKDIYKNSDHRHYSLFACVNTSIQCLNSFQLKFLSFLWVFQSKYLPDIAEYIFYQIYIEETYQFIENTSIESQLTSLWKLGLITREIETINNETFVLYYTYPIIRIIIKEHIQQIVGEEKLHKIMGETYFQLIHYVYDYLSHNVRSSTILISCRNDFEFYFNYVEKNKQGWYGNYLGASLERLGDSINGKLWLEKASRCQNDKILALIIQNNLAQIFRSHGQTEKALELLSNSLPIIKETGDFIGEITILNNIAVLYQTNKDYEKSLDIYNTLIKILQQLGKQKEQAIVLNNIGSIYSSLGKLVKAYKTYYNAIQIFEIINYEVGKATTFNNIAELFLSRSKSVIGLTYYKKALSIFNQIGDHYSEVNTCFKIAIVQKENKQYDDALFFSNKALSICKFTKNSIYEAQALAHIGEIYISMNKTKNAYKYLHDSANKFYETDNPVAEANVLTKIADYHFKEKNYAEAINCMTRVLAIMRKNNNRKDESFTCLYLAILYMRIKENEKAIHYLKLSVNIDKEIQSPTYEKGFLLLNAWEDAFSKNLPLPISV